MKVLLINGSPNQEGCTYTALREIEKILNNENIETEIFQIGKNTVPGCKACMQCRIGEKKGRCIVNDGVNQILEQAESIDGIIVGSPVYYASPNGSIISFLDRLFYSSGGVLAYKPASAIVSARRGGTTSALEVLNKYFSFAKMPIITSQYWNIIHGNTPEEVVQDLEGMQIMRTLGKNMAWLLKSIEAGKKAGISLPKPEAKIERTNFIR